MKRILIVEDELLIAKVYALHLEKAGHQILGMATDHNSTLNLLQKADPDLFLLDIQLKKKECGIELAHKIRKLSNKPIIFTTGNSTGKTLEETEKIENCLFMIKPIDVNLLIKKIEEII